MEIGDRIGDRWRIVGTAPGQPGVGRWRAVDVDTGQPAEVLALRPPQVHPPRAQRAFHDVHRRVAQSDDPALVAVHDVRWDGPRAVAIRAPLEDPTLADVEGPLDPAAVAALGARLVPAVLAAGPATAGALTGADVGIDSEGQPVLAPRGQPGDRVQAGADRFVAPEVFEGGDPDAAAGLYGLGALLYRLTTRRLPGRSGRVPAGSWVAGVPPALDRAIEQLLSEDPEQRASALPLLQQAAGTIPDLRPLAGRPKQATMVPGEVRTTTEGGEGGPTARRDVPRPRGLVVVPGRRLGDVDPSTRSRAAGWAALPVDVVSDLARAGRPLVVEAHRSAATARRRADELADTADLPVEAVTRPGWSGLLGTLVLGVVGAALGVGALATPASWLAVVAGLAGFLALFLGGRWGLSARRWARARGAWQELERRPEPRESIHRRLQRVHALRRQLPGAPLPPTAEPDLRSALREIEQHLAELDRIAAAVENALGGVDVGQVRTRLSGAAERADADPSARRERDRLTRTVSDLEAVQERRRRLMGDLEGVDEVLDELAAVLAEAGTRATPAGPVLERLRTTTRLTREALDESGEGPRPRPSREPQ